MHLALSYPLFSISSDLNYIYYIIIEQTQVIKGQAAVIGNIHAKNLLILLYSLKYSIEFIITIILTVNKNRTKLIANNVPIHITQQIHGFYLTLSSAIVK